MKGHGTKFYKGIIFVLRTFARNDFILLLPVITIRPEHVSLAIKLIKAFISRIEDKKR